MRRDFPLSLNDGGTNPTPLARQLVSWNFPCTAPTSDAGEKLCPFTVPTNDVCVTLTFTKPASPPDTTRTLSSDPCPVGPGDQ